jgi:hypothetical protein
LDPLGWKPETKENYVENYKKVSDRQNDLQQKLSKLQGEVEVLQGDNLKKQFAVNDIASNNLPAQRGIDAEIEALNDQLVELNRRKTNLTKSLNEVSDAKDKIEDFLQKFSKRPVPPLENMAIPPRRPKVLRLKVNDTVLEVVSTTTIKTPIPLKDLQAILDTLRHTVHYSIIMGTRLTSILNSHYSTDVFSEDKTISYKESSGVEKSINTKIILGPKVSSTTFRNAVIEEIIESKPDQLTPERLYTYERIHSELFSTSIKITKSQIDNQMIDYLMERKKFGLSLDLEYAQNIIQFENLNVVNKVNYKYLFNNYSDVSSILKSQISFIIRNPIMFV